jgi:hypothetical protein
LLKKCLCPNNESACLWPELYAWANYYYLLIRDMEKIIDPAYHTSR